MSSSLSETVKTHLINEVEKNGHVDVSSETAGKLGITRDRLRKIINELAEVGYKIMYVHVPRTNTNLKTTIKFLAAPDTTFYDLYTKLQNNNSESSGE